MRKLINDTGKISLLLSRSFEFTFFSTSNVCSDHGVIDLTAKSRLDEWLRMYVLIYTLTLMTLLEIAVYDRLPVNFAYNMSTKKQKGGKKETREEEKLMAIVRTIANMSDFSIIPTHSLFVFLYISSIKELSNSKIQKKKLIYLYKYTTISLLLLIYTSICVCVFMRSRWYQQWS